MQQNITRERYNDYISRETAIRVVDSGRTREQMIEMLKVIPSEHGEYVKKTDVIKSLFQYTTGEKTMGQCIDECPSFQLEDGKIESEEANNDFGEELADEIIKMCF